MVFSNISLQGSVIKVLAQASSNTDIQSINNEIVVRVNNDGESYMNDPTIGTAYTGKSVTCLLYTSPSPRDRQKSRMPSSA